MQRAFLIVASISGFVAVGLGAFGSHALRARLTPERIAWFETGVRYQMWHTLALLAVVLVGSLRSMPRGGWVAYAPLSGARPFGLLPSAAGWLFVAGIVLFSGSLYALAATGARRWARVTPVGGLAFLLGWLALLGAIVTA